MADQEPDPVFDEIAAGISGVASADMLLEAARRMTRQLVDRQGWDERDAAAYALRVMARWLSDKPN